MNKSQLARQLGALGGQATLKKHGKKLYSEAGKKGMAKRWANHIKKNKKKEVDPGLPPENPLDMGFSL